MNSKLTIQILIHLAQKWLAISKQSTFAIPNWKTNLEIASNNPKLVFPFLVPWMISNKAQWVRKKTFGRA